MMTKLEKEQLKEDLRSNKDVTVLFTKADGTDRKMNATLHEDRIPEEHKPKGLASAITNDDVLRVFDLEAIGWRSFRYDSVISFFCV